MAIGCSLPASTFQQPGSALEGGGLRLAPPLGCPSDVAQTEVVVDYFSFKGGKKGSLSHLLLFGCCDREMERACAGSKSSSQDAQTGKSCLNGSVGKQVGPYGGSREGWYKSKVQYPFLAGLSGGYVYASEEAARHCWSLAGLHGLGTNAEATLPIPFLSRAPFKSVQLLSRPVESSRPCEGLAAQGNRGQLSLPIHQS